MPVENKPVQVRIRTRRRPFPRNEFAKQGSNNQCRSDLRAENAALHALAAGRAYRYWIFEYAFLERC